MRYIDLPNGTLLKAYPPKKDVPFFNDWLGELLKRKAAIRTSAGIVPLDRHQEQAAELFEDGQVGIVCLSCAEPRPTFEMSKIRIGALVQFPNERPIDDTFCGRRVSMLRTWNMRMVAKQGLGCPNCAAAYLAEVNRVAEENAQKQAYTDLLRAVYVERGDLAAAARVPDAKLYTPFLDVLEGSITLYQFSPALAARVG